MYLWIMFSKNSSSFHVINSDHPLGSFNKILYLVVNSLVSLIPTKLPKLELFTKFRPADSVIADVRQSEVVPVSPGRFLSNAFWDSLNYDYLKELHNGSFRVIEIGCGTGRYGHRIARLADIESYEGLDLYYHSEWNQEEMKNFQFHQDTYANISKYLLHQNLIVTQSALEHFESDVLLLKQISTYATESGRPIMSIHLFPSATSLYTFLWHGIRQYGRLQLARLVRANGDKSTNYVFSLGGITINFFHFVTITIPQVVKKQGLLSKQKEIYFDSLVEALKKDSSSQSKRFPAFTALITTWNQPKIDPYFLFRQK